MEDLQLVAKVSEGVLNLFTVAGDSSQ